MKSLDAVGVHELENVCHIRGHQLAACGAGMVSVAPSDANRFSPLQITDRWSGQMHTEQPCPPLFPDLLPDLLFRHQLILSVDGPGHAFQPRGRSVWQFSRLSWLSRERLVRFAHGD